MFEKIFPMKSEPVNLKDCPFRMFEFSRSGSFQNNRTHNSYNTNKMNNFEDEYEEDICDDFVTGDCANPIYEHGYTDDVIDDEYFEDECYPATEHDDTWDDEEDVYASTEDTNSGCQFDSMDINGTNWESFDPNDIIW